MAQWDGADAGECEWGSAGEGGGRRGGEVGGSWLRESSDWATTREVEPRSLATITTSSTEMTQDEFSQFVQEALDEVILIAENKCGKSLPRKCSFRWLGQSYPVVKENIVEHIVQRVFVDEEHIYPCVDLGVADLLEDGSLLIVGSVAGYSPRPFGHNWTGREGPFVPVVGAPLLNRMAGKAVRWSPDGAFAYITPDLEK